MYGLGGVGNFHTGKIEELHLDCGTQQYFKIQSMFQKAMKLLMLEWPRHCYTVKNRNIIEKLSSPSFKFCRKSEHFTNINM